MESPAWRPLRARPAGVTAAIASAILVLGLWLPWATLSVTITGSSLPGRAVYEGQDMGDDFLSLPTGWVAAIAGVLAFAAVRRGSARAALLAALAALVDVAYTLVAMPSELRPNRIFANPNHLLGHLGYGWGVFVVLAAAIVLMATTAMLARSRH